MQFPLHANFLAPVTTTAQSYFAKFLAPFLATLNEPNTSIVFCLGVRRPHADILSMKRALPTLPFILLGVIAFALFKLDHSGNEPARGTPLEVAFTSIDGKSVSLASMKGKVVLIDFWATWCPPCVEEVPHVVATYRKLHDRGLEIIGISLDENSETVRQFCQAHDMPWEQYCPSQGEPNEIAHRYQIESIPTMWLVDRDGRLATTNARENLEEKVQSLLNQ